MRSEPITVSCCRVLLLAFGFVLATPLVGQSEANAQRKKVVFSAEDEESEENVIVGSVHKPEVGYIITRQEQEDLETLQLKESFIPKIVKSVDERPF